MYHTNDQCLITLLFRKWKYFCLYFFLCSKWKRMLLNEKGKFALTFKIETKLRDQGTSLLRNPLFFWCLKSLMAWTACGILGILGGDYSRRRSPRPPTELATCPLKTQKTLANELLVQKETWHIETKLSLSFNREWTSYNKCARYTKPRRDLR